MHLRIRGIGVAATRAAAANRYRGAFVQETLGDGAGDPASRRAHDDLLAGQFQFHEGLALFTLPSHIGGPIVGVNQAGRTSDCP